MKKLFVSMILLAVSGLTFAGNCDHSWQRDSAGNACGGRSSDSRPGGK